nr:PREDICTED: cholesterol 7-desaturase-like [Bemisia tabaci]
MYVGRFECLMDAHIEDIVQNAADNAHVDFVHAPSLGLARADLDGFWKKLISFFANLTQKTSWEPNADHPHLSWGRTEFQLELFKKITIPNGVHLAKFVGPGYIEITTSFSKVKIYMPMCITPIGPLTVRLTGRLYARPFQILMARPILRGYRNSFEQDAPIWNYGKPRLQLNMMKEEGALVNFRRWYSQFYSKNSPCLDCNQGKI